TGGAVGYAGHGLQDAGAAEAPDWRAVADSEAVGAATEPFHGARQAGVTTPPQANAAFVGFDIIDGATRAEVQGVLRTWSQDAARLTEGRGGLADLEPELAEDPARLTVTIGFGPGLFDAIGMPDKKPDWLEQLPPFPEIDQLEDRWSGGDLRLQICADDPLIVSTPPASWPPGCGAWRGRNGPSAGSARPWAPTPPVVPNGTCSGRSTARSTPPRRTWISTRSSSPTAVTNGGCGAARHWCCGASA